MIAAAPRLRAMAMAPGDREERPYLVALVAACTAVDAVAAGMLLLGTTTLPPLLVGLAAGVSHGTVVLLLNGLASARPSRRWLCVAAVLTVPCVGAAVAAAVLFTSGRGSAAMGRRRKARRRRALTIAEMQRLGEALSPCDALECGDEEQRRAALSALSRRAEPEVIALLLRTVAGRDPDLALSAALVLDEISAHAERHVGRLDPAEVRHVAG